jgi:hypothetical protein
MPTALAPPTFDLPALIEEAKRAVPPSKIPKGYFDAVVTPTRILLDNALTLPQAADWLIAQKALDPKMRRTYLRAIRGRLTRFRARESSAGEKFEWKQALGYERRHLIGTGTIALCSASGPRWFSESGEPGPRCLRCKGIANQRGIAVEERNGT